LLLLLLFDESLVDGAVALLSDGAIAVGGDGDDGWVGVVGGDCCGGRVVVGTLGALSGLTVGLSMGGLVGESDGADGVDGGVIMSVGVGAVSTTGAGVVGGIVVGAMGDTVGDATGKMGAGVGMVQVGEEQFPKITNDTVVFDPLACVQI
jgi:hypothetical protein